jgi:hypothetical protein
VELSDSKAVLAVRKLIRSIKKAEVAHVTSYSESGIAPLLKPTKLPLAAARAMPAVGSDLLFARMDLLMFRGNDKRKGHPVGRP